MNPLIKNLTECSRVKGDTLILADALETIYRDLFQGGRSLGGSIILFNLAEAGFQIPLHRIREGMDNALEAISRMLDFSRFLISDPVTHCECINFGQLIACAVQDTVDSQLVKGNTVHFQGGGMARVNWLPLYALVIEELIINACKYGPEGGEVDILLQAKNGNIEINVYNDLWQDIPETGTELMLPFRRVSHHIDERYHEIFPMGTGLTVAEMTAVSMGGYFLLGHCNDHRTGKRRIIATISIPTL